MISTHVRTRRAVLAAVLACGLGLSAACSSKAESETGGQGGGATKQLTLGFSQVGSEGGWRAANSKSVQESAKAAGIKLDYQDAQLKQENQIASLRHFVEAKVSVIAFSPVVESGWDTVLQAAKDAKIPVILTDRAIDTTDTSLYKTVIGSDLEEEGRRAGKWLAETYKNAKKPVKVVQIEGTTGSTPANDRRIGFADAIEANKNLKVIDSKDGKFTREGGKEVMAGFLKKYPDIEVVYAHNDDEGLGAVDAIEAAGKKPGVDIKIITVDATKAGLTALAEGKMNYVVECNPLLGPQLMDLVKRAAAGESLPNRVITDETTFDQAQAKKVLPERQY